VTGEGLVFSLEVLQAFFAFTPITTILDMEFSTKDNGIVERRRFRATVGL